MTARRLLERALGPLLIVAAVLVQFAPVLRGRVYRFEDVAGYFEPLWTASARAMASGRLPIWEAGAWSGQPVVGDPQAGVFYPPNWIWLAMPVLRAYAVAALVHAAFAGLGMYALVRLRGRSVAAAALTGTSLAVGGFVVLQVRHIMFVEATAWVPWVAAAAWRYVDTRGRERLLALAGLAAATGMMMLTGGISMIYYAAWFLLALLVPRVLDRFIFQPTAPEEPSARRAIAVIAGLAFAGLVGLGLAAQALLPAAAHGRISPRGLGVDESFAASVSWSGFHLVPTLFIPNLLGQDVLGNYLGGGTQWEIAGYYAGMLPFALALLALVRGERKKRLERRSLGALFLVAILLAPGLHSPLHALAYRVLPLYNAMRCPARALYVFSLGIPLLAADGLDVLVGRLRRGAFASPATGPRIARALSLALPLLTAADLLWFQRAENPSISVEEAKAQAFPRAAQFLAAHRGDRYINDVHLDHALHNSGLLWGLENASGYSSIPIWRYLHLLWIANHGAPYPHARLHDDLAAQGIWRFSSPLVDALNIRWVLAPAGRPPDAPGFVRRYPVGDASSDEDGIAIYENLEVLRRGWVVHRARILDGQAASARAIASAEFRPAREVILEQAPSVAPVDPGHESGNEVEAMQSMHSTDAAYLLRLETPGLLVLSMPLHPGWRATLDGNPAPILAADYALMAVAVPAGSHEVFLRFFAPELERGQQIAGGAALVIAAMLVAALWLGRRRKGRASGTGE